MSETQIALQAEIDRLEKAESDLDTIVQQLQQRVAELEAENEQLREALDTELICCHIGTLDSCKSPKHAVAAIGRWHYDLGVSRVLEGGQ